MDSSAENPAHHSCVEKLFRRPELFDRVNVVSLTGDDFVGKDPSPALTVTEFPVDEFECSTKASTLHLPMLG